MKRLFDSLGVDFEQWKALTAVLLKLDFRTSSLGSHAGQKMSVAGALFFQFVFYTLAGVGMALVIGVGRDLFLGGTIVMTITMFLVGTAVLLDHNSAIASPTDYGILGFRPITSRTYFAVRLTNVVVYTTVLTTVAVWLPVAALFVRYGPMVGAAGIAAFYACSTTTTLAILTGYAGMIRAVGPNAVKRALSYVQLIMSFLVYGGYFVMSRLVTTQLVSSLALTKTPWLLIFPATWFTAYLEFAAGKHSSMEVIPVTASILVLGGLAAGLGGRLSLDYSERLGAMLTAPASRSKRTERREKGMRLLFRAGEARCVALLVRSQFQNDQRFRMGVLSILPLTLVYVFMGLRDGGVGDPFLPNAHARGPSLVSVAVLMFPSALKAHLTRSEGFRASWIFFACPVQRFKIVTASKDVLVAFFLVPYLAFLVAVFTYFSGNVFHAIVHVALLGCLSHLALQITLFLDPALPFSRPPAKKGENATAMLVFSIAMVILSAVLQSFSAALYSSPPATLTTFALVLMAGAGVARLTRVRVKQQTGSLEFEG